MLVCDHNGYPIEGKPMTAEYQEDVDGLTLGQCVDHPKWPRLWLVTSFNYGASFGIFDASHREYAIDIEDAHSSPVAAARAALKTLLPPRPKPVVVTEEDREFANQLSEVYVPGTPWEEVVAPLIAAYRTKHAGAKS